MNLSKSLCRRLVAITIFLCMMMTYIVNIPIAQGESIDKIKVVLVLGSDSYIASMVDAYKELQNKYPLDVKIFSTTFLENSDVAEQLKDNLKDTDVLLMEMIGSGGISLLGPIISEAPESCHIYSTRSSDFSGQYPNIDYSKDEEIKAYFTKGGVENMRRLLLYLGDLGGLKVAEPIEPSGMPSCFIYHPDAKELSFNAGELGKVFYEAINEETKEIDLALVTNTAHHAVYEAVYEAVYDDRRIPLAQDILKENIIYSESDEKDWNDIFLSLRDSNDFIASVADAVYNSVYSDEGPTTPIVIDASYHVFYEKGDKNIEFKELSKTITDALKSSKDTSTLFNQVKNCLETKPAFPGIFENLEAYKAWYKKSGHFKENGSWIGISTYDSAYKNNDIDMYLALLKELEQNNANVMLVFTNSRNRINIIDEYFMRNGKSIIDAYIAGFGFNYKYGKPEVAVEIFNKLNVPVITPTYSRDLDDWEQNSAGIMNAMYWQIAMPEMDGRIEPVFMGGTKEIGTDPITGAPLIKKVPLDYNIKRLAGRVKSWADLKNKENEDKKIALIYYSHHGGKDDFSASYLNTIESASNILEALKKDGYKVEGEIDPEAIKRMYDERGRNVGSWAPGEMEKLVDSGAITIPVEKYLQWYNKLPEKLKEDVEKEWGKAPGNVMVVDDKIIIPGMKMGNIFIGPQPMRGWGDDPSKIAHSPELPPTHQYIAFYLWLQNELEADAVIHLGTHGTLEWLPGRSVGLGEDDWPDQLIGNMININPYIMNNPGEATQSKRRGYGITIDHLIPPMIQPELYGDLVNLQDLIIKYLDEINKGNNERAVQLQNQIVEIVQKNNLDKEIDLDLTNKFYESAEKLHEYLEAFTEELMPYGLHTLGEPPKGELFDKMVDSIVNYDKENRESDRSTIEDNLALATQEITNILRALNGGYIEPGPGKDPVRIPDALPTGRNIVTFDPREIPDKAAWETGKKAADQLIEKYKEEYGKYPESVGVVLWAIETMRTNGETVGMIMRLIGTEPVYNKYGRVDSVKVTPIDELGRPRVDVVVTISGLFRDTFLYTAEILDEAFRLVQNLDESSNDNYLKKHYDTIKEKLKDKGIDEETADTLAGARIFGDAPGTYGTGVSEMASATNSWDSQEDLVDVYMKRMSFIYGKDILGENFDEKAREVFKDMLSNVDIVTQIRDSIWGTMDNDDVAQYLGGLSLAAKAASGEDIVSYIVNTRKAGDPRVQSLSEFVSTELRTRVFNHKWIEGMLKEGFSGSVEIGKHIGNMFLMDATLDAIDDWGWQKVAETFIFDETIRSQLDPYVIQAIIGWNLEAARRDMWNADDKAMEKLSNIYIETAVDYGVVCCHHTCANIKLNELAANFSTLDKDILNKFKDIFKEATDEDIKIKNSNNKNTSTNSSSSKKDKDIVKETIPVTKEEMVIPVEDQEKVKQQQEIQEQKVEKVEDSLKQVVEEQDIPLATVEEIKSEPNNSNVGNKNDKKETVISKNNVGTQKGEMLQPEKSESKEETQECSVRAYEIEKNDQNKGNVSSAVSLSAIMMALALVGLVLKGYIMKK
ncbi:cobaltochelatase subunit CobN [Crassaminicella thermophila]|uniref:Cobaltochelatase subunit CobN n=1 Tax=Crassaminicella thermophila TaxID=2599308 RepID=A0A5C0SFG8_CRATE|nr:cobaltochelatase subunit CobN [Crassaminicella thermophila]QEK12940.1 cobaltochelatase subunit CobN [Crassaminicella thermophila]